MDKLISELGTSVSEMRTTNSSVMNRMDQLILSVGKQQVCNCNHRAEESMKDVSVLQTKFEEIESKAKEDNQKQLKLIDDARSLQNRLESIESWLLSKQTDDSKLNLAAFGNESKITVSFPREDNESRTRENKVAVAELYDTAHYQAGTLDVSSKDRVEDIDATGTTAESEVHLQRKKNRSHKLHGTVGRPNFLKHQQPKVAELYDTAHYQAGTLDVSSKDRVEDIDAAGTTAESKVHLQRKKNRSHKLHGTVGRPNFLKHQQPKVTIVKQEVNLALYEERHWRSAAQNELDKNRALFQQLEGVHSVICLDISESMSEGNAWPQACTFLTDYLKGLEEMSKLPDLKPEHVALVTFGHETKLQMRYTDRYSEVQTMIDNLNLGGPSQMYGGVLYSLAAVWCSRHQTEELRNGVHIFTKIIMITDGKPTESDLIAGPDIADSSKMDETKAKILQELERFRKNRIDLFFVPVGTSDISFFKTMVTCSEGMILSYESGRRLARRQYLSTRLLDPFGLMTDVLAIGSDYDLSPEDKEDMRNIQEKGKSFMLENTCTLVDGPHQYHESKNERLPAIGSRVRRGPDWTHKWQDSNGPGTLIGHSDNDEQVWVEWDTDEHKNIYRYGHFGYDVLVVDESRVLKPGQEMAVGCAVTPGKDWKGSERKLGHGVVIKLDKRNRKAMVRWNDGKRGDYSYGDCGLQEIEIKSSFRNGDTNGIDRSANYASTSVDDSLIAETIEEYAAKQERNKNKNKS